MTLTAIKTQARTNFAAYTANQKKHWGLRAAIIDATYQLQEA